MDVVWKYGILIAIGGSLLVLEMYFDAEDRVEKRRMHVGRNLLFGALGALFVGIFYTWVLSGAVSIAGALSFGGLLTFSPLLPIINYVILFVLFDLVLYLWHVSNHKIPFLWRFHQVHHSDRDLDFSSAVRFHVGELLLSILVKAVFLIITGVSLYLIAFFDLLVTAFALYNHANLSMGRWDFLLRKFIVTPDMHRIHHSLHAVETDSNYTTMLSLWDRVFGTYTRTSQFDDGVGLRQYMAARRRTLVKMFTMPFGK